MGKRIVESQGEVKLAASVLAYYASKGPGFLEPRPARRGQGRGGGRAASRSASCSVIEPWNFPL